MEKELVVKTILGYNYYNIDDLRYNKNAGLMLSKSQLDDFIKIKDELIDSGEYKDCIFPLPLKSFNSKHIFYVNGQYLTSLIKDYYNVLVEDMEENENLLFDRNIDEILTSRIFSEIEGSLKIENVPTTHKRIKDICGSDPASLKDKNDIIIKNMQKGIDFVLKKPKFNKDNLLKLYNILSDNCLDERDKLKDGQYYRDDSVTVGPFEGANAEDIDELMDSLFDYVASVDEKSSLKVLLPHICHYYIVYVHPYFDYNGRTARMVSLWISKLFNIYESPLFISDAINEYKSSYYKALTDTRLMKNDLTYFLGFILETSIKYSLIYRNIEEANKMLAKEGNFLSEAEKTYLRKILASGNEGYFNTKIFIEYSKNDISKQAASKILSSLVDYNVLETSTNKKNEKIYKINDDIIKYKIN